MKNNMQIFQNEAFGEIRTLLIDGEPWFVAADVCKALLIVNSRDALTRIDDDEKGVVLTDTLGGRQEVTIVNEPGLYDDNHVSDDWRLGLRTVSFDYKTRIVLCARHPAFAETVRHQRHLSFAACCGCSYNTCLYSIYKENEKHCKPKNGGADGRLRRGKQITPVEQRGTPAVWLDKHKHLQ